MSIGRSREDYLKAIYVLQEQTGHVRGADVARRLHISAPSVVDTVIFVTGAANPS